MLRFNGWTLILLVLLLMSSVSVVYFSFMQRQLFQQWQQSQHEQDRLQIQWGQLLLERGALAAQSRVEAMAINRLGMQPLSVAEQQIIVESTVNESSVSSK